MKKLIALVLVASFLAISTIGCSGTPTTGGKSGGTPTTKKEG